MPTFAEQLTKTMASTTNENHRISPINRGLLQYRLWDVLALR
jgi:hypothetical protein